MASRGSSTPGPGTIKNLDTAGVCAEKWRASRRLFPHSPREPLTGIRRTRRATISRFTPGSKWRYAFLLLPLFACGETAAPDASPDHLTLMGSLPSDAVVGAALPIKVRVVTGSGSPVAGVPVAFTAGAGGSFEPATVTSDAEGVAASVWTLGTGAGAQTAEVSAAGVPSLSLSISASPDEPAAITLSADSLVLDRWGDAGSVVTEVRDRYGNPIGSAALSWSSSDTAVARVVQEGTVSSWKAGNAVITVAAAGDPEISAELPVRVAVQRNVSCVVPTTFPAKPAAGPVPAWVAVADPVSGGQVQFDAGHRMAAGDFDGDGDEDAIVLDGSFPPNQGGRTLFWRNVGGTFEDATAAAFEPDSVGEDTTRDYDVADFNGDGVPDLFRAQHGYDADPYPGAPNVLLLSQPDGTMADVSGTHITPNEASGFTHTSAAADIDCDGDPDVFTSDLSSAIGGRAYLYVNDGAGHLVHDAPRLPADIADGSLSVLSAASCDFDRDGDPDLFLGRWGSATPDPLHDFLLVNDGFGRFRRVDGTLPPSHFGAETIPSDVACGDLDLDGWPDLVIGSSGSNFGGADHLAVWMNRGDLVFEEVVAFEQRPEEGSNALYELTDMNGDGWLDVVRGPSFPQGALLINAEDGSFTTGDLPRDAVHFIDANGDGRKDALWPGVNNEGCACAPEFWIQDGS